MTTPSAQELNRHLQAYSAHVDNWSPEDIDTFLMLGYREWLDTHKQVLNDAQRRQLATADARVLQLAAHGYDDSAQDEVDTLRRVVAIITVVSDQKAA